MGRKRSGDVRDRRLPRHDVILVEQSFGGKPYIEVSDNEEAPARGEDTLLRRRMGGIESEMEEK